MSHFQAKADNTRIILPKRVLFITYYFPPSGGSGVQRPVKFVKYLPRFGWQPTVLTVLPESAAYVDHDTEMVSDIPDSVDVIRTKSWDPYNLYSKFRGSSRDESIVMHMAPEQSGGWRDRLSMWVRANVFVPDARVGWVPFVVREARRLHRAEPFDAVVTTSPPHSVHLAGRRISNAEGIPWLADFRDPWTNVFYRDRLPTTGPIDKLEKRLERKIVQRADAVVTVSDSDRAFYEKLRGKPVSMIPNGFDPDDMPDARERTEGEFIISHVGVMNETRNPDVLWDVLSTMTDTPGVRLELTGRLDADVRQSIDGLSTTVDLEDNVAHTRALERMLHANLLLFVVNRGSGSESMIPAKVYEYLAAGIRILGIGPVHGDATRLIEKTGSGRVFAYDDQEGIRSFLEEEIAAWRRGEHRSGCDPDVAARYSRLELTAQLASELSSIATDR